MRLMHDCEPSLDDKAVLDFCCDGFIILDGACDPATAERAARWHDDHAVYGVSDADLMRQEWFIDGVLRNATLGGVLRSLLGSNFGLPAPRGAIIRDMAEDPSDTDADGAPSTRTAEPREPNCPFTPAMNWRE